MARQSAPTLARPRSAPRLSPAWRRGLLIGVGIFAALGLLYLGARETPVFALRTVEVQGAPAEVRATVLQELEDMQGTSLVSLDGGKLVQRLEALPTVQSVTYDRAFPHTLRLVVQPEQPVAVANQASALWIVSVRGRVIARTTSGEAPDLPRIRYRQETPLAAGEFVADPGTRTVLAALAEAPKHMRLPIHGARLDICAQIRRDVHSDATIDRFEFNRTRHPCDVHHDAAVDDVGRHSTGDVRAPDTSVRGGRGDRPIHIVKADSAVLRLD